MQNNMKLISELPNSSGQIKQENHGSSYKTNTTNPWSQWAPVSYPISVKPTGKSNQNDEGYWAVFTLAIQVILTQHLNDVLQSFLLRPPVFSPSVVSGDIFDFVELKHQPAGCAIDVPGRRSNGGGNEAGKTLPFSSCTVILNGPAMQSLPQFCSNGLGFKRGNQIRKCLIKRRITLTAPVEKKDSPGLFVWGWALKLCVCVISQVCNRSIALDRSDLFIYF